MIVDQLVRDQVLDNTQSFLVQAPAGSGKTSLLVQRFLSLLAKVQQAPEEIIALTFTRKAAAEMRDRIIYALQLGLKTAPAENDYQYKLWALAQPVLQRDQQEAWNLIDNPARLKIQTIDALCSSITTQMPIISQFGAQPQIESKPEFLYQKAVDQLFQDSAATASWQNELDCILEHLDNDRTRLKKLLVNMLKVREQWLPIIINNLSQQDIREILENSLAMTQELFLSELCDFIPMDLDFSVLSCEPPETLDECLILANILLKKDHSWRTTVTAKEGFTTPDPKTMSKQECAQLKLNKKAMHLMLEKMPAHEMFRKKLIELTKLPAIAYTDAQWEVLNALAVILRVLAAQLTLVFKDSGQVDFSAVTLAALGALSSIDPPSDLALALDYKLCHILVDEFQDTSSSQFQLLEKLTANWELYDGRTLFLVGDPMQSIYRFRKAEVGLFLKAKQQGINKIQLQFVQLTQNFRSTPQIVAWVNRVFAASFPQVDDIAYGAISYMSAQALWTDRRELQIGEAVICSAVDPVTEAALIVDIIQSIKKESPNKSIAILVRYKRHLSAILPALRAQNIEYQGIDLETLEQSSVIQDLLALTKALLHFDDRIAWLAILRAPWCGLTLSDLAIIAQPEQTIWHSLQQEQIIAALSVEAQLRVRHFKNIMQSSILQRGRRAIELQVQMTWQALGAKDCLADLNGQREADTYFSLLAKLADTREIFKQNFIEQHLEHLFLQSATLDPNAVQIMTMHKAKGLEFDVVLLPGLAKKSKSDEHELLLIESRNAPHDYLLMAPIKSASEQGDRIYKYLAWSEAQRQAYEDLRLLYVATTRAKEKIYCFAEVAANGPIANSLLAKIWPSTAEDFIHIAPMFEDAVKADHSTIKRLPSSWYARQHYVQSQPVTQERKINSMQHDWLPLVGTVVHRSFWQIAVEGLEHWDQQRLQQLKPVWLRQLRQLGLRTEYYTPALAMVERAVFNMVNDSLGVQILSGTHPESYAEWNLTVYVQDEFRQVILDRAFLDKQGQFWIVDYKVIYDDSEISKAIELYKPQILKYFEAVSKLRPGLAIKAGLYLPLQTLWIAVL